jgi:DtxR family Mn-dependent transcriptional regulator
MAAEETHSRAVEDYLKAVYKLERVATPASTTALADLLNRSAASVTNMVKNLADQGLVEHEPYHGVRLSPTGRDAALRIIRRHRIIETYLIERLGYTWDGVHTEAERLEHAVSDELIDRMARALGDPDVDPHGAPIPSRDGTMARLDLTRLADLPAGHRARVRQVSDDDDDRLRTLSALGLLLGTEVELIEAGEAGCRIRVDGVVHELEPELAADILVEPCANG